MASRRTLALVILLASSYASVGEAQGCSQCRDNVSQTNPAVQASYRQAILILIGAVAGLTTTAVVVIRKLR